MNSDDIPNELKEIPQWVATKDKVPFDVKTGQLASVSDEATWTDFERLKSVLMVTGDYNGGGYVHTRYDGIVTIDIDDCHNSETGELLPPAADAVRRFDSYTEISASGTGLHIVVKSSMAKGVTRWIGYKDGAKFEFMYHSWYVKMTGNRLEGTSAKVEDRSDELHTFVASFPQDENSHTWAGGPLPPPLSPKMSDEAILQLAREASNGQKFASLYDLGDWFTEYPSQSEADFALARILAFYTQCENQMQRLFESSALWRKDKARTLQRHTLPKAITLQHEKGEFYKGGGTVVMPMLVTEAEEDSPFTDVKNATDRYNAVRFHADHADRLMYVSSRNEWYVWTGTHWQPDTTLRIEALADESVRRMITTASTVRGDAQKKLLKQAERASQAGGMMAMLKWARHRFVVDPSLMDADKFAVNFQNGTVDARTGELHAHRQEDRITVCLPFDYDEKATAPLFESSMCDWLPDPDTRTFVQQAFGMAITGDVSEQCFFIFQGEGEDGKSTCLNAVLNALGPYGMQATGDLLLVNRAGEHPTKFMDLRGKRLVVASEVEEGRRFAEALVKMLTGGENIRARRMRQDYEEFEPTHTIFLAVNPKPVVTGTGHAIWRRIHLIRFAGRIDRQKKDARLGEKLREEAAGIAAWAIRGCIDWQTSGLRPSAEVDDAVKEYRRDMDLLGEFINECCECDEGYSVKSADLNEAYRNWCRTQGEEPRSRDAVGKALSAKFQREHKRDGWHWKGLRLLPELQRTLSALGMR